MTGKVWLIASLLMVSLMMSACGDEATETPTPAPAETPTSTPAPVPIQPSTPVPTADLESVVRRVLAEVRAAEPPTETPEPDTGPTIDYEALTFEVTQRVLATLEARVTPTPEPTPEPTPDPTPTPTPTPPPTPTLPEVVRTIQNSMLRITAAGDDVQLLAAGVVVSADTSTGEIFALTAFNRLKDKGGLEASTSSGAKYEAVIHGSDEKRDLALLRICCDAEVLSATFGDALTVPIGNEVVALQYGLQPGAGIVVTRGVLSSVRFDAQGERWLIQTDASASGETGGVLITPHGRLVGLISGADEGFTDAISEVTLSEVLDALR